MLLTTDGVPASKIACWAKGRQLLWLIAGLLAALFAGGAPFHSN